MEYDLKITNGTIYDGTGKPGQSGDLAVKDGKVVALGKVDGSAHSTIDADGMVVAPGFVDIHTHYDAQILWDPMLSISSWHGVTTVVMGNCGFALAPTKPKDRGLMIRILEKVEGMNFDALETGLGYDWAFESFPQYLDAIERCPAALNAAVLFGHTPVRLYVMGEASVERAATDDEIVRMSKLMHEGLTAGAIGFATSQAPTHLGYGGKPVPSRLATLAEIETLCSTLRDFPRTVIEAAAPGPGLDYRILGKLAGLTDSSATWNVSASVESPGSHRPLLKYAKELGERGVRLVPQVNPRPFTFEFQFTQPFLFEMLPCFAPAAAEEFDGKMRVYADPQFRANFKKTTDLTPVTHWDRVTITWCPVEPALEERVVADVARERGVHPVDLALDLALASKLEARFRIAAVNHDEEEVAELLSARHAVLGAGDGGAHASQLCDACSPTYLLGRWVREKGALPMEEALRMLTSRPAEVFGLTDRGLLGVGRPADIVIFDPKTVGTGKLRRVYDLPAGADRLVADAIGMEAVIVNGTPIRRGNRDVVDPQGPLPGKLLRHGHAAA